MRDAADDLRGRFLEATEEGEIERLPAAILEDRIELFIAQTRLMNATHPTAEQLARYRRRAASPAETLAVDAHIATCDRCFNALSADAHLTFEELEAILLGREPEPPHLALCGVCRRELADLQQLAAVMRGAPRQRRRWMLAAAPVLAIAVAVALLMFRTDAPPPAQRVTPPTVRQQRVDPPTPALAVALQKPPILATLITAPPVLRGSGGSGAFALREPVGTVVLKARPYFLWEGVPGARSYEVAVLDIESGAVVASGRSSTTLWQPKTSLTSGKTYAWQVRAGRVVSPGPKAPQARFHIAERADIDATTPLARGIALANLGALDDAERALERAGAGELLREVRSWRDPGIK